MNWENLPRSDLFELVRKGKLKHPTNSKFSLDDWNAALEKIESPSTRDLNLKLAAKYYGFELGSLRKFSNEKLPVLSLEAGISLLAATANQQFLTGRKKLRDHVKATVKSDEPTHLGHIGQKLFETQHGQQFNADDIITHMVDSLPCWLFRILHEKSASDDLTGIVPTEIAGPALQIASIETGFRNLWQETLWQDGFLDVSEAEIVSKPGDKLLSERWLAWANRQENLYMLEVNMEAMARTLFADKVVHMPSPLFKTVTRTYWGSDDRRKFTIGRAKRKCERQRGHSLEQDMLERLYTGLFIDESLPSTKFELTCRELMKAWWVISDLAELVVTDIGTPWFEDDKGVAKFAIPIDTSFLPKIVAECLNTGIDRACEIVDFLTCDTADTHRLFSKGFWAYPLLPSAEGNRCYLLLAPLLVGSAIKRIEEWMQKGGIADEKGLKSKGTPFESYVIQTLSDALQRNEKLNDNIVLPFSIQSKGGSEQIDFVAKIGQTIVVGEVKCLVAPSEPIEKKNLLDVLESATDQAARKSSWLAENFEEFRSRLDIDGDVDALKFQPVVVLNHGFGLGLLRYDVPVVDLHFMRLIFGSASYQGDTRIEKDVGMMSDPKTLYSDQDDFEEHLSEILVNPKPFKPYVDSIGWRKEPFPNSTGHKFFIEIPTSVNAPSDAATVERLEDAAYFAKLR